MIDLGIVAHGSTSVILHVPIYRSDTGMGMTGLTNASSGLSIGHSYDNNSGDTDTEAGTSSIENVSSLYTYTTPTAGFVRFGEINAATRPGLYQIMFEDSVFSETDSKDLYIDIHGVADMLDMSYHITLDVITEADITALLASYGIQTKTEAELRTLPNSQYATETGTDAIADQLTDFTDGSSYPLVDIRRVEGIDLGLAGTGGQNIGAE